MLYYLQPSLEKRGYLPTGNTINNYIRASFFNSVPIIQDIISQSISKIHLSFDIWTSRQQIGFFGIHAHFYTPSGYQNILLALPRQSSHHTGMALARTLYEKLSSYGVTSDRIGWFVADNASNNDTCLEALSDLLEFEATERRLRCAGHIFNLVAHSILFGIDNANLKPCKRPNWKASQPCAMDPSLSITPGASLRETERARIQGQEAANSGQFNTLELNLLFITARN
jgi:hypothetical protein